MGSPAAEPHRVTALVFDGMKLLDLAGPFEVFAEAARFGARYELEVRSSGGAAVRASTGMRVPVDGDVASATNVGTALVVGGDALPTNPISAELTAAATALSRRAARTASVCTGAFVLAGAGLLDGRRATTHWQHARLLAAAFPRVRVEPDAIFVQDGTIFTSAGVSAGIDLALALVERDHGEEIARSVAQSLVVFLQRPGGQSQFSPSLALPRPGTPVLRQVTERGGSGPGWRPLGDRPRQPGPCQPSSPLPAVPAGAGQQPQQVRGGRAGRRGHPPAARGPVGHRLRPTGRHRQPGDVAPDVPRPGRSVATGLPAAVPHDGT